MNCSHLTKNGINCKLSVTKEIDNIYYCTRHYNSLLKNNQDDEKAKSKLEFYNIENIKHILNDIGLFIQEIGLINSSNKYHIYKILLNDKYYALKIQNLEDPEIKNIIYYEYVVLKALDNSSYIVKLYDEGKPFYYKKNYYAMLITEFLYETLEERKNKYEFTIDDIKLINIQLINIIKYIHGNQYLYINLSPSNIMFTNEDNINIKLINFNNCNKYINHCSEFLENILLKQPVGNLIFSSININKSYSGLRIDDIESILWILLYCLNSKISIKLHKKIDIKKIISIKEKTINEVKCVSSFINKFIIELKEYDNINNKRPNYNKFINILKIE